MSPVGRLEANLYVADVGVWAGVVFYGLRGFAQRRKFVDTKIPLS